MPKRRREPESESESESEDPESDEPDSTTEDTEEEHVATEDESVATPRPPPKLRRTRGEYDNCGDGARVVDAVNDAYDAAAEAVFMKDIYVPADPVDAAAAAAASSAPPVPVQNIVAEYAVLAAVRRSLAVAAPTAASTHRAFFDSARERCDREIQKLVSTARCDNTRKYAEALNLDYETAAEELVYFKTRLSRAEQETAVAAAAAAAAHIYNDKPQRVRVLETEMPAVYKSVVLQKLATLDAMDCGSPEYFKIKGWVDAFMRLPFGKYRSLSISLADGPVACADFMSSARQTLDECVYGLRDAKMQILQMLGQWVANPASLGGAVAIHGPMGTGKTSIVKNGISKILGRAFAFVSLGGASGGSFLDGHSYTYEGSTYGKIAQVLMDVGSMNPVIYFDELDKLSECSRGNEIANLLIHLTDPVQNGHFRDNYFTDVSIDLSKCMFIFSYNDASKVNPILRDRMYNIRTSGYSAADKRVIAHTYLLPRIREQVNFSDGEVVVTDAAIDRITGTDAYSEREAGVRNLNRCLEVIHTKLNLVRLMDSAGFEGSAGIAFPCTVDAAMVDLLLRSENGAGAPNQSMLAMYT
jgi:ATP-dependent Lon protease